MPTIEVLNSVPIGQSVTLTLRKSLTSQDCYILQNRIMLPEPVTLQPDEPFHYSPEAPGHYIIRGADCEASFDVLSDFDINSGPTLEGGIWFPSAWQASVNKGYESSVMAMLPQMVRTGSVVYDIGANIGLYAKRFLELMNQAGYLYCFEPSPLAIHYLSHNLRQAAGDNYLILPLALSDRCGKIDLVLNPDNEALGSMVFDKRGIRIGVSAIKLDVAISRFCLRLPDVIKMDIEAGEMVAIKGMLETIEKNRPVLIFELHGQAAAKETLKYLDAYRWQVPGEDRYYSAQELSNVFPESCVQVIGRAED